MKNFYLLKPRLTSILVSLLITLQISACNNEENITTTAAANINSDQSTDTSSPAVITGVDSGSVTEDDDPDNDNLLESAGKLNITDSDAGEAGFIAATISGNYGNLTIDVAGNWLYSANNNQSVIQNLVTGASLNDSLVVLSLDGTMHTVVITIFGADANINLTWVAPTERENNDVISLSEIAGYKIYYGTAPGQYTNSVTINDSSVIYYTFQNFTAGNHYFVVTTVDTDGRESTFSSAVMVTI